MYITLLQEFLRKKERKKKSSNCSSECNKSLGNQQSQKAPLNFASIDILTPRVQKREGKQNTGCGSSGREEEW